MMDKEELRRLSSTIKISYMGDCVDGIYDVQEYQVLFELTSKVDLVVNVYHQNTTKLTGHEILEEALGYLEEAKL